MKRLLVVILLWIGFGLHDAESQVFEADYIQALDKSTKEKKPMIILFIDADLASPQNRRLNDNFLNNPDLKSISEGISLANQLAPEHCEIMLKSPKTSLKEITTAGAIFIGPWTPTVLGDYLAGPSHTLPTGGAGVSFSGLTVDMFQRRTSVVQYTKQSLARSIETIRTISGLEGLDGHGSSAEIRTTN